MSKYLSVITILLMFAVNAQSQRAIVVDSISRYPLSNVSVFDSEGKFAGVTDNIGRLPYLSSELYPIIIRCLGFKEKYIYSSEIDSVYLQESIVELPEVIVESNKHKLLHMLAYVREYSSLTTYSDTIFLFREKMVDYMIPMNDDLKYKGWKNPRILKSKSYYRFTNVYGLDSVSDRCNHHFSWSDWVGVVPSAKLPTALRLIDIGIDTIWGKYSPTEIWKRNSDKISIVVNVLADTLSRKWVPNLNLFFKDNLDFEQFRLHFNYANITGDSIISSDLTNYSFLIESNGRGRNMFMFNHKDEPFFVSTYTEVYVVDKEYITLREAKKWEKIKYDNDEILIIEPQEAPELQPAIQLLVDRVNSVDHNANRLKLTPDKRLAGRKIERNLGQKVFQRLKNMLGISNIIGKRKQEKRWKEFREEQIKNNRQSP